MHRFQRLAAALAVGFAMPLAHAGGAHPAGSAQATPAKPAARPAAAPRVIVAPTVIYLRTERVGSAEPGPQAPAAARREARAAMAEAKRQCRSGDDGARDACLETARRDRDRLLEQADGRQAAALGDTRLASAGRGR